MKQANKLTTTKKILVWTRLLKHRLSPPLVLYCTHKNRGAIFEASRCYHNN